MAEINKKRPKMNKKTCVFVYSSKHRTKFEMNKKVENGFKKAVQPAFGCAQHPKTGRNTQQLAVGHGKVYNCRAWEGCCNWR